MSARERLEIRHKRKMRIRKKVFGTPERPRMSIYRSSSHVYVQVIDDVSGKTVEHIHSFKLADKSRAGVDVCRDLGKKLAEKCKKRNIDKVVFDKNGFSYHGRLKAFADGAREGGLVF